ncbi:hypothetical protein K435DRAFT_841907 [Dendrothele bispora CBS 962.96]|uniref:DUF6534 domain-containing protein n=1 Tax=Dendrothele bispora (strain CBS 962.96) TaxID=1314807 RepID=A0A4S8LKR0_DENBC|nr:hypothetical protein K435DRAFT_841907 [Dendrothele bispora CBS 962.96]
MSEPPVITLPVHISLGPTLGLGELGILFSAILYGIVLSQTYTYYQASFKKDSPLLKYMVAFICLLETLHSVFLCIAFYWRTVTNFGNFQTLNLMDWTLLISNPLTVAIACIVQTYFSYRVYVLSSLWLYPVFIGVTSLLRLGLGIALAIVPISLQYDVFLERFRWLIIFTIVLGFFIDISNTITLCIFMDKNYNPMLRTWKFGDKILVWTIETGSIISLCGVIQLVLCLTLDNYIWVFFSFQTAKLYSNALLASLNGRISLRSAQAASHIPPTSLGPRTAATDLSNLEVRIEMGVERRLDDHDVSSQKMGSGDNLSLN